MNYAQGALNLRALCVLRARSWAGSYARREERSVRGVAW